jgi:hypothetical protein
LNAAHATTRAPDSTNTSAATDITIVAVNYVITASVADFVTHTGSITSGRSSSPSHL